MNAPEFRSKPACPPFASWLHSLVRSKSSDQVHQRTSHSTESRTNGVEERGSRLNLDPESDKESLQSQVHRALRELEKQIPDSDYRILFMHWIEGRTIVEIATFLNLSIEQVWACHRGAIEKFRSIFKNYSNKGLPTA